jgi:hypothetical protein
MNRRMNTFADVSKFKISPISCSNGEYCLIKSVLGRMNDGFQLSLTSMNRLNQTEFATLSNLFFWTFSGRSLD